MSLLKKWSSISRQRFALEDLPPKASAIAFHLGNTTAYTASSKNLLQVQKIMQQDISSDSNDLLEQRLESGIETMT